MHRKSESDLFPLDTELERTLRNLRKVRSAKIEIMVEERMVRQLNKKQQQKRLRCKIQWRISRDHLFKKNIQQLDNHL